VERPCEGGEGTESGPRGWVQAGKRARRCVRLISACLGPADEGVVGPLGAGAAGGPVRDGRLFG
jgi:hypothetical protein